MVIKPTKEDIELDDLINFFKSKNIDSNSFNQIEGPRKTFPDFIAHLDNQRIYIEITRAPSTEDRMEGKSKYDEFINYISPTLQELGIEPHFLMNDGPTLCSHDA